MGIRYQYLIVELSPRRSAVARISAEIERPVVNLSLVTTDLIHYAPAPRVAEIITKPIPTVLATTVCALIERDGLQAVMNSPTLVESKVFIVGF